MTSSSNPEEDKMHISMRALLAALAVCVLSVALVACGGDDEGGGGGGGATMAQAGGGNLEAIPNALARAREILGRTLSGTG